MQLTAMLLLSSALVWQGVRSRHYFHMLQLNSYRNERYFSWLRKNRMEWRFWQSAFCALALLYLPTTELALFAGGMAFVLGSCLTLMLRKPEKRPFVVTERVRRQLAAASVLVVLDAALLLTLLRWALGRWGAQWLDAPLLAEQPNLLAATALRLTAALELLFPPALLPPIANAVMMRHENRIQRGFIDAAKEKLASQRDLIVIGVTGSYGKTSVKYILSELLAERYNTLMTPESFNTTMGVVRTINEQLRPHHQVFVCEMGARQVGDIAEICEIVKPRYGIITAVGIAHLETFRTTDNIVKTKFELAYALPPEGVAFLNMESAPVAAHAYGGNCVTYGFSADCDYYATDIAYNEQGATFVLHAAGGETVRLSTRLLGRHNVLNITGAAALALHLGVPADRVAFALRRLRPVPHRLEFKKSGGLLVIDDAYNANPEGAAEAVAVLGSLKKHTRIMITPGMVELGESQGRANTEFGRISAEHCDYVIAVGRGATDLINGLDAGGFPPEQRFAAASLKEAMDLLPRLMGGGQTALLLENDLTDDLEGG